MRSPFPGMDPFIEATPRLWEDFHNDLIIEIKHAITRALPPRYVVRAGERSYVATIDPEEDIQVRRPLLPDVSVHSSSAPAPAPPQPAATALVEVTPGAVPMRGLLEGEHRETFLEVRDVDRGGRLVTGIEVLSPSNKDAGTEGWHLYREKRRVFFLGHANFVEIDLLRGGRRHPMAQAWPASPCDVLVLRQEEAPKCRVWPAFSLQPLPTVPIPLLPPDSDIAIALQPLVDSVYANSRYAVDIDYRRPIRPPLSPEESAWLEQHLPPPQNGPPSS